jgi:outer membrane protein assembly factor BamB
MGFSKWIAGATVLASVAWAEEVHPGRLVISDAKSGMLQVLDLEKGAVVGSFSSPGPANVYATPGGQFAFAVHREANRVSIVYGGMELEDHGNHADIKLSNPYSSATLNTGPKPTHFFAHGKDIAIFNDGDGTVAVFNQDRLGLSMDFSEISTGPADHGAPVVLDGMLLSGGVAGGVVSLFTGSGRKVMQFPQNCPRLHGEAVLGAVVGFGCGDGVLLLEKRGSGFAAKKIPNPAGTPENVRVGTLISHAKHLVMVGNFGKGLVWVDPKTATLQPFALPANPASFKFDADGRLVVLTADGNLHTVDMVGKKVVSSLGVTAPITASGEGAVRPSLAVGDGMAYISLPDKGEVLEVDLATMQIKRKFAVGGTPGSVALLQVGGVQH